MSGRQTPFVEGDIDQFPVMDGIAPRAVPLPMLNEFGQQRPGRNTRQDELTRSIRAVGMINPVNGVLLDGEHFEDYLSFTNQTWQEERNLTDFVPVSEENFCYMALIAGHSRLAALSTIAQEDGVDPWSVMVPTRIHQATSVSEILAIQVAENVHSAPPPDRAARGYAEAYLWEKMHNPELTKAGFVRRHGLPRERLRDALYYCDLPSGVRAATDDGGLPFSIAIELARALQPIQDDVAARITESYGAQWPGEAVKEYEEVVELELLRFIVRFNTKRNITETRAQIRTHAEALRAKQNHERQSEDLSLFTDDKRSVVVRKKYLVTAIKEDLAALSNRRTQEANILHHHALELLGVQHEFPLGEQQSIKVAELGRAALASA